MKKNIKKTAAVALATIMSCGLIAGCDLVTRDDTENFKQVIAEVNITDSENFAKEFSGLNSDIVSKVISTVSISKQDLIVSFLSSGYNAMNSYGWTYKETFDALSKTLVQRAVYIQYAKAYFLKNGWADEEDGGSVTYYDYNNLSKFNAAVKDSKGNELTGLEYDIAALGYFLTPKEKIKAEFTTRSMINNSIDSGETSYIKEKKKDEDYDSDVRTKPDGLDKTNSDFYDEDYRVYTGTGKQSSVRGSYEKKEGSTQTTRRRAYYDFLATLKSNDLVQKGEDTSDIESLNYFLIEKKADYEEVLISKLKDTFVKDAETKIDSQYCNDYFNDILTNQSKSFTSSSSALESAMDGVSDSKFVLTATGSSDAENSYGFVINILLPFSTAQSDELSSVTQDYGDKKGNKFVTRSRLLAKIKATDQRGSWFRGETDYSYDASEDTDRYTGGDDERTWLFFEDNLKESSRYERLKNYLGKYTYNGTWDKENRKYRPKQITLDNFLDEMKGYLLAMTNLSFGDLTLGTQPVTTYKNGYYSTKVEDYYYGSGVSQSWDGYPVKEGDVNYSKFIYAAGKITSFEDEFDANKPAGERAAFDANQIFLSGSAENKVMSVINELAFAYNTDTSCLNKYFGYAVTANKTSFVSEFEYAAQLAVKCGAGSYVVVPSDYGWHIMYCTFSFVDSKAVDVEGVSIRSPYQFNYDDRDVKGTFSNLFYEMIKSDTASDESTNRRSKIVSSYNDCYTIYEDRYKDLSDLDSNSSGSNSKS